ncbi:MAG: DUF2304 domain-containing protein [Oscillospiraceae bacterium]|nr:DUF2304 domain-containing protein [Oscillospiraceae bacterium]
MQPIAQIFTVISILVFFIFIVMKIRKGVMDYKYALVWICLGLVTLIFSVFPASFAFIARKIQIAMPLNLLFFLGILVCLAFIFTLITSLSKLKRKFYILTQKNAILDKTVNELTYKIDRLEEINGGVE